jgi:hypothetical protein
LNNFFDNIDNGKPVNFDSFIKKFLAKNVDISSMFQAKMSKKPYYYLTPKNIEDYTHLKSNFYVNADKVDRIGAAQFGNSHHIKCSYSYLLYKEHLESNVSTLFFKENFITNTNPFALRKKIIIIENIENFGNLKNNFRHSSLNINEYSFIFGSGDSINNKYFSDFFNKFDEVLCLFDIDKAGFEMFEGLENNHKNCKFIYPDNIDDVFAISRRTLRNEEILMLNQRFSNNEKLHDILNKINIYKKTIEQELYLVEDFNNVR